MTKRWIEFVRANARIVVPAAALVLAIVALYVHYASVPLLLGVVVPGILGAAFVLLWGLATATGLTRYGLLFLGVYAVSVATLEAAAWCALRSR